MSDSNRKFGEMTKTAFLFPGQGSCVPGILRDLAGEETVTDVLRHIDAAASRFGYSSVRSFLIGDDLRSRETALDSPGTVSVAIFATSVALNEFLCASGQPSDVLVGHSVGELAALVAGGWLSLEEGVRLLCEREALLDAHAPAGGLLAVELGVRRAEGLVAATGDPSVALASDNGPRQTVLSGTADGLAVAAKVAGALDVRSVRLQTPYPFHGPLLAEVSRAFGLVVDTVEAQRGRRPVFSPILGRQVDTVADAMAVLRGHLVHPVRFRTAVSELLADGVERFVECGAKSTLVDLTRHNTPGSVSSVAPLARRADAAGVLSTLTPASAAAEAPRTQAPIETSHAPSQVPAPRAAEPMAAQPQSNGAAGPVAAVPAVDAPGTNGGRLPETEVLVAELRGIFAETLGYPPDVLTDDVDLEADLGISSIKQIELFTTVLDRYDLPTPAADIRPGLFPTLTHIAAFLRELDDAAAKVA